MSGDLLATKLFLPSARPAFVRRPRLDELVSHGLRSGCRLTLVAAPAGFGKTTLVTGWLSHYFGPIMQEPAANSCRAAWLSLDEADNDPFRFLAYIIAALRKLDGRMGEAAAAMLQAPQPPPAESVLTSLLNDIVTMDSAELPNVLVLDDYHLITAPAIHNAITFLLEYLPPHLHLILITRSDPPLPLSRFRVRGQMSEIRQSDLRFTSAEAMHFLNDLMGLSLSIVQVETLAARTEGWIAGLQLAALSMRGQDDVAAFVDAFSGSHRFVMDYLVEEVVRGQPDHLQQFLLQTAILGRLSGPLCEAVTGQNRGQESLIKLEESNLFLVPLDDERIWYRYHHLFADVLAARLQTASPGQIPELHLRAARWLQQNGLFTEAIEHALKGHDYQLAAEIVESQVLSLLKTGGLATLLRWLDKLPSEIVAQRPRLQIAAAWVYLLIGKLDRIGAFLASAENNLDDLDNAEELRGEIAAIRTYFAAMMGQPDQAIDQAQRALALLDEGNLTVRCVVAFVLGGVYFMRQELQHALEAMNDAGQLALQAGNLHVAVSALSSAGDLHRRQGNFAASENTYVRALQIGTGRSGKPMPIAASVYSGLAALRLDQGDLTSSRENALIGLELGKILVNAESQVRCYLTLAQIEHLESHADAAGEALAKAKQLTAVHQLTPGLAEQIAAFETAMSTSPPPAPGPDLLEPLTDHELNVLRLIAAGLSNREVAGELFVSINTVKWHLKNIYEKLDVHSRVAAVTRAQELGLL